MPGPYNRVVFGDEVLIDLTDTTAIDSDVLSGKKYHKADGSTSTGTCTYDADTSDATATAGEILATKTAYVDGAKVTGTMVNRGNANVELNGSTQASIPIGFYDGSGKAKLSTSEASKLVAGNIKSGVTILGVAGSFAGDEVVCTPAAQEAYTTEQVYSPADFPAVGGQTPTAFANFTVKAIAKEEVSNAKGTGLIIGKVKS